MQDSSTNYQLERFTRFVKAYRLLVEDRNKVSVSAATEDAMTICENCGKKSRVLEVVQLRSADEESNSVSWCISCGDRRIVS